MHPRHSEFRLRLADRRKRHLIRIRLDRRTSLRQHWRESLLRIRLARCLSFPTTRRQKGKVAVGGTQ
jgi:hypothetical protein